MERIGFGTSRDFKLNTCNHTLSGTVWKNTSSIFWASGNLNMVLLLGNEFTPIIFQCQRSPSEHLTCLCMQDIPRIEKKEDSVDQDTRCRKCSGIKLVIDQYSQDLSCKWVYYPLAKSFQASVIWQIVMYQKPTSEYVVKAELALIKYLLREINVCFPQL